MDSERQDPDPDPGWYYNTRTGEIEHGAVSRAIDRMGPYPDEQTARHALEIARERTEEADEADRRWR